MKKRSTLQKLLSYIKPHIALIVLALVFSVLQVAATLLAPVVTGRAIDYIAGENDVDFERVFYFIVLLAVCIACVFIFRYLASLSLNIASQRAVRDLRRSAFLKLHRVPLSYIDSHKHGDIMSVIVNDIDQIDGGLLQGFQQLFTGIITIVGTLMFMLASNWLIAVCVVLLTPISLFVAYFIAKGCHDSFTEQAETRGRMNAYAGELIDNRKLVRMFDKRADVEAGFEKINQDLRICGQRAAFFSALVNPCTRFINALIYLAVAVLGATVVMQGDAPVIFGLAMAPLSVGGLSCVLSYANQYTKPFNEITGVITEVQAAFSGAKRVFELLEAPEMSDDSALPAPAADGGRITIENVCFSYVPEKPLIENFNLSVERGKKIAIVGPTGCGKTTLINLLMRFYDVNSGSISLDGKNIEQFNRDGYRDLFGMVLQDTWIKKGTVRENIAFGKEDAAAEEIESAAKKAHIHSFIKRLPDGYDTVLSEDGGNISHGQKQLLCIARVLLASPEFLILDEATSSIDTRTELKIQDAFASVSAGKTSFIVAHRLSTIREADVILVMKDGNVIEQGDHETLMAQKGFYHDLYSIQFQR